MRKFKKALKGRGGRRVTKADYRELAGMLGSDAGPGIRRKANRGGRKLTKKQRKAKAARTAKKSRVAKAAKALLRAVRGNPAKRFRGALLTKYKDGSVKITPVKGVVRK
jgi:hypothetical protein